MAEPKRKPLWQQAVDRLVGLIPSDVVLSPRTQEQAASATGAQPYTGTLRMRTVGSGGQEMVAQEFKNPRAAMKALLRAGDISVDDFLRWEANTPAGRASKAAVEKTRQELEKVGGIGPYVSRSREEQIERKNRMVANRELLRMTGAAAGPVAFERSPFGVAATRALLPKAYQYAAPSRVVSPTISDMSTGGVEFEGLEVRKVK